MNPDLLAELRRLFMPSAPADVTATPAPPRQMTIGPRTGTRTPLPEPGMLAAIQRSAQPSPDTPGGMLNESFNPVRAGAQARELTGRATGAMRRGEAGRAAGLGALAAMAVPGIPKGSALTKLQKEVLGHLEGGGFIRAGTPTPGSRGSAVSVFDTQGKPVRKLTYRDMERLEDSGLIEYNHSSGAGAYYSLKRNPNQ